MEVARAAVFADVILVVEAAVEPDRRIEGTVLVDAQPGQLIAENFRIFGGGEIALGLAPIGNRARDAPDELLDAVLAFAGAIFAIKIFGNDHFGRQNGPILRHLDVLLFEDRLPGFVGDFRGPLVPLDFIERADIRPAKNAGDGQAVRATGTLPFGGTRRSGNPTGNFFTIRL